MSLMYFHHTISQLRHVGFVYCGGIFDVRLAPKWHNIHTSFVKTRDSERQTDRKHGDFILSFVKIRDRERQTDRKHGDFILSFVKIRDTERQTESTVISY